MKKKYLYEIDLMRMLIMLGVLTVHTMSTFDGQLKEGTYEALLMSSLHSTIHVTRMCFMFITGFILFIVYYNRNFKITDFWKKRMLLIGIPYVFWNVVYILFKSTYSLNLHHSIPVFLKYLVESLLHGDQFFLYYVLVTFQFYLVFPFMLMGLKKFEKWHLHILIGSVYLQLLIAMFIKFIIPRMDTSHWPYLLSHYGNFILSYQCYFIIGGIAACHYQQIGRFIDKHSKLLIVLSVVGWLTVAANYFFNRWILNEGDPTAQSVHQPIYLPYVLLIIALFFFIGRVWSKWRAKNPRMWLNRLINIASVTSFGIYLIQPFPLYVVSTYLMPRLTPNTWSFYVSLPLAVLFVYFSSMLVAYAIYKTPILSYCIGRKSRLILRKKSSVVSERS